MSRPVRPYAAGDYKDETELADTGGHHMHHIDASTCLFLPGAVHAYGFITSSPCPVYASKHT